MSAREEMLLTGQVSKERLEALIEKSEALEAMDGIAAHIEEAGVQYPAEDFLEKHKDQLMQLRNKLRGSNREAMDAILESLDDLAQMTFYSSEYGRSELNEAMALFRASI
jgi:hypothetical protein